LIFVLNVFTITSTIELQLHQLLILKQLLQTPQGLLCNKKTTKTFVLGIQVNLTKFPRLGFFHLKFGLYRTLVYSEFGIDRFHCIW